MQRRLLYVAMTRAKDRLFLVVPHRFYITQQAEHGDKHLYAMRSRFIPTLIVHLRSPHVKSAASSVPVDISARRRWRIRRVKPCST